jgi:hypothetical protein
MIILDDIHRVPQILDAWNGIGVPGATILKSAGAFRVSSWLQQVGLEALHRLFDTREIQRKTLLVVLDDEELLNAAVAEAERVVGGFDQPNTGILMVLPVAQVRGLNKTYALAKPILPDSVRSGFSALRETPIEDVDAVLELMPAIVNVNDPLDEVARQMLQRPWAHLACVVSDEGMLKGLLSLEALTDDLMVHILPEEFLSEITDMQKMLSFADKSRMRTAGDAMSEPHFVKHGETLKDAFVRLHKYHLPGIPVVDQKYQVVGYINQLEILGICLGDQGPAAVQKRKEAK